MGGVTSVPDRDGVTVAREVLDFDCPCLVYFSFRFT